MVKACEEDNFKNMNSNDDDITTIQSIENLIASLDEQDSDLDQSSCHRRKLKTIANRTKPSVSCIGSLSVNKTQSVMDIPSDVYDSVNPVNEQPGNRRQRNSSDDNVESNSSNSQRFIVDVIVSSLYTGDDDTDFEIGTMREFAEQNTLDFKQIAAFEILASSYVLRCIEKYSINTDEGLGILYNCSRVEQDEQRKKLELLLERLEKQGGKSDLFMLLSGMGGSGKSNVIDAFMLYVMKLSKKLGWPFNLDTIKITAMTGSAASLLKNGRTCHKTCALNKKDVDDTDREKWNGTIMVIVDEVSFMTEPSLEEMDKKLRQLIEQCNKLFGGLQVVISGDFHQLHPVGAKPLYKVASTQMNALTSVVFLNRSHRFKHDVDYGEIMRRCRKGDCTQTDVDKINERHINNPGVELPEGEELRYACATNSERNSVSASVFMKFLEATHTKADQPDATCPSHTVIIKATMKYQKSSGKMISRHLRNMIYDTCGDDNVRMCCGKMIEPVLKFYTNAPFMMNSNDRIEESLANGTPCYGMYIRLRDNVQYRQENWEGYLVNTVYAHEVDYIICKKVKKKEKDPDEFFKITADVKTATVSLPTMHKVKIGGIIFEQFRLNCNIATTVHKLQGVSTDKLVIYSWNYKCANWIYVVLSRVKTLKGLVLCAKLNCESMCKEDEQLDRFEEKMRKIEKHIFRIRDEIEEYELDLQEYA